MKFANIRELKLETNKVLSFSKQGGPVVITQKGKPVALLRSISEDDFSVNVNALWDRVRKAAEKKDYTPDNIDTLIKTVRTAKQCKRKKSK
jgi:prevent-host-death family protein